jgi:hypothetical protein
MRPRRIKADDGSYYPHFAAHLRVIAAMIGESAYPIVCATVCSVLEEVA